MERKGWKERNKTYWNEMREQRMEEAMASRDSKDERVGERGLGRRKDWGGGTARMRELGRGE